MTEIISATMTLEDLTAQIKMKLVENQVLENDFNRKFNLNSIEIGVKLTQAKKLCPHGEWQNYLADNFAMTIRTAQRYMKVAAYFGVNSTFKNDNVVAFAPAALIELTKLPAVEVQKFLAENPAADKLSVRNLRDAIKKWKVPAPVRVPVDAENKNAPAPKKPQKENTPPPFFATVPAILKAVADKISTSIEMNFGRALYPADSEILITRTNATAIEFYSAVATCVVFALPFDFVRSDGKVRKIRPAIWYFGGVAQEFIQQFGNFGVAFYPQKKPASTGEVNKPINNSNNILPFKGGFCK